MPMELGLELVATIRAYLANAEWELFNDVLNEVDGDCLRGFLMNLEGTSSGCIIDLGVLEPVDLFTAFPFERLELDVYLDVATWNLVLIALGMQFTHTDASRQSIETVAFENVVDASIRDFDAMIAH